MRRRFGEISLVIAAVAAIAIGAAGCTNACTALSEKICGCKPNQPEEAACLEQVRLSAAQKEEISEAETAACEAQLEQCECADLEDGNLARCGLAKALTSEGAD